LHQLPAAVKVMSMCLNRQGSLLLVNCSDKAVRLYEVRQRQRDAPSYSSEQLKQALDGVEVRRPLCSALRSCQLQLQACKALLLLAGHSASLQSRAS
jgi:hypothetical protein